MSKHAITEGGGDPAIKLFGTTIAVPFVQSQKSRRSSSFDKFPPCSEDTFLSGKLEREQEPTIPPSTESSVCGSEMGAEVLVHQRMESGTAHQAMGSAAVFRLKKKKKQLNVRTTVVPQEKSCHGSAKVVVCPRCDSFDTKFCYYNNYNVNQPRHFCKHCQRYWTAGGTLRNVPVGAGRRKNKSGMTMMQRHLVVDGEATQGDALECRPGYAIALQQTGTSDPCLYQGKIREMYPLVPKGWAGAANVPRCFDEGTCQKHISQDDLILQLRSCSEPTEVMGDTVWKLEGRKTTGCNPDSSEVAYVQACGWTASSRLFEVWPCEHSVDRDAEIGRTFQRNLFVPHSPQLNLVPASSIQGQQSSWSNLPKWQRSCESLNWAELCWVSGRIDDPDSWAPNSLVNDSEFRCHPLMRGVPIMIQGPETTTTVPIGFDCKAETKTCVEQAGQRRHVNPMAMRRSMVFQEFN